jgi:hypothetical protein
VRLTDLIKGKAAVFVEFHGGNLFYEIDGKFRFPVPVDELQGTSVLSEEKASVFMKWVKRALKQIQEGSTE